MYKKVHTTVNTSGLLDNVLYRQYVLLYRRCTLTDVYYSIHKDVLLPICTIQYMRMYFYRYVLFNIRGCTFTDMYYSIYKDVLLPICTIQYIRMYFYRYVLLNIYKGVLYQICTSCVLGCILTSDILIYIF